MIFVNGEYETMWKDSLLRAEIRTQKLKAKVI